ncbi:hypothetical protein [Paenisporosarcina sp. TG20]|uniref:hypothetical protein n=1 Tax=Paenisporosarcina sp. TG20 TaxID=1211706 RepID=UPI0002FFBE7F|nr:hypothetical protein [Paenisporosarcina sp. TG20]
MIEGKLTFDQGYDLIDELINKQKHDEGEMEGEFHLILGLDEFEWTAICHVSDLGTLAK